MIEGDEMCVWKEEGGGGGKLKKNTELRLSGIESGFRSPPRISKYIIPFKYDKIVEFFL